MTSRASEFLLLAGDTLGKDVMWNIENKYPDRTFTFDPLETGVPETELAKREEDRMRAGGGPEHHGGRLQDWARGRQ